MLKTNLSTRPFYNERRVHMAAALVGLVVVAFTVWNVARLITLSSRRTELRTETARDEQRTAELRSEADRLERSVDNAALTGVAGSAREANAIIDRRTFSWTAFFNSLEETLPPGVMLAAVSPQIERGEVKVAMTVVARRAEDVDEFMERLEASGAFRDVLADTETVEDSGLRRALLSARYLGGGALGGQR
ncbi:MAG: PilN domain-containing protein [Acidobacteriota bacterium]|nr:PilN domain-containing protein [Acidobacteriota bacterium]